MNIKTLVDSTLRGAFVFLLLMGTAYSQTIKNAIPDVARPLPLSSVRLTGGPLKRAQDLDADYLLKLEPDRMMAYYRKRAGLEPRAQGYPGWDGDGRNLTGHTFRLRAGYSGPWQKYDTAESRKPVMPLAPGPMVLSAADLSPTLPADIPVQITRSWMIHDGHLVLNFKLKNKTKETVQIWSLGMPMIFNNILTGRSLKEAHERCSFSDPYVGKETGYLQVTRLNGQGPALVVVPYAQTTFEAYQLLTEPTRPNQTFEGAFEWLAHTGGYIEDEWRGINRWNDPWNPPSIATIAPGSYNTYGVKFLLANEIRKIEATLAKNNRTVVIGIPGYVLPMDIDGRLFIKNNRKVGGFTIYPVGALELKAARPVRNWQAFKIRGKTWGRARLTITYEDGRMQPINYYIIKPSAQAVTDLGHFLFTRQWLAVFWWKHQRES